MFKYKPGKIEGCVHYGKDKRKIKRNQQKNILLLISKFIPNIFYYYLWVCWKMKDCVINTHVYYLCHMQGIKLTKSSSIAKI